MPSVAGRANDFSVWPEKSSKEATPASQPYVAKRPDSKHSLLSFGYAQSSALQTLGLTPRSGPF
ncbi:hypothetical protein R50076_13460 [Gilvimarinus japonicus]